MSIAYQRVIKIIISVFAAIAISLYFWGFPSDTENLAVATAQATITNQEAVNTMLDEYEKVKAQVNQLIVQSCYLEGLVYKADWALFNSGEPYVEFDQIECQQRLQEVYKISGIGA